MADPKSVDRSAGGELLVLSVPADQVILFDLYDWNKILQLRPLTDDPREEKELLVELSLRGLDLNKVMLPAFTRIFGAHYGELAAAFPSPSGPAAGGLQRRWCGAGGAVVHLPRVGASALKASVLKRTDP